MRTSALRGFFGVADLLIEQIDLLLHDLIAVLQGGDEGLLPCQLLFQRVVFRPEGRIVGFARRKDKKTRQDDDDSNEGTRTAPHGLADYPSFGAACPPRISASPH